MPANAHDQRDVTDVTDRNGSYGRNGSPRLGDEGFPELVLAPAVLSGHITHAEAEEQYAQHKCVRGQG
jgi:hypothetical protein